MDTKKRLSPKAAKWLNRVLIGVGLLLLVMGICVFILAGDEGYTVTTFSMGSYVQQRVYGKGGEAAASEAAESVSELEELISWRREGDVFELNENAGGQFTELDPRTEKLLALSREVNAASGGAFSVTIAPLSRLWSFDENPHLPEPEQIESFREKVDDSWLLLPGDGTAALKKSGMALDLGAVGKGAACDAAVEAYEKNGISQAIVSVGGSVGVYGKKPLGRPWKVAVRDPSGAGALGILSLESGFVSTSGSYEKTFTENGKTYHHILDPATGYPAESGLLSVTVKSESGALSDALSTACFVLGPEKSLPVLNQFQAEAVFVTEDDRVLVTTGLEEDFSLSAEGYTWEALS